jgi:hypothetical protein
MNGRYLDSDGDTRIYASNIGNIIAAIIDYKKLFIQNDKSRETGYVTGSILQYGDSDGYNYLKWALCPDTLSCPFNVVATLLTGGDLIPDIKRYYRITAFNNLGETGGSLEVYATPDVTNKSIKLTWSKVEGEGYIIYCSTNQNYDDARRAIIEDPDILEWTDTGQVSDPSSPYGWPGINTDFDLPDENTTAGEAPDYGTPPLVFSDDDLEIGYLQSGEQKAFWLKVETLISTLESGNPRNVILDFPEV